MTRYEQFGNIKYLPKEFT